MICPYCKKPINQGQSVQSTLQLIKEAVAEYYDLAVEKLAQKTRKLPVVRARHIGVYISHQLTSASFPEIAAVYGLDRSSIYHALEVVEVQATYDVRLRKDIAQILQSIEAIGVRI